MSGREEEPMHDANRQIAPSNANDANISEQQAQQQQQQQQPNTFWSIARGLVFRLVVIYCIMSYFRKPQDTAVNTGPGGGGGSFITKPTSNLFQNGTEMDVYFYVTENSYEPNFNEPRELIWSLKNLVYGDWYSGPNGDSSYTLETTIKPTRSIQNNGSLWLHIYVVKAGYSPYRETESSSSSRYSEQFTVHRHKRLNRFKKRRQKVTHNLISGEPVKPELIKEIKQDLISHWHPNLTVNIVDDHTPFIPGRVPQPLDEFIEFEPISGKYYPIVFINDYWNLLRDYQPINETVNSLTLSLTFQPISMFRFQLYSAQQMKSKWSSMLGAGVAEESEDEQDFVKEAFLETSPYLLGLTVIVSITHSVFEFLAFKNDIQFWKNRKSLEGLSVRSVFFNVFQSVIVLLYVLDNDTNTLIKVSIGIGLLIELWKIHKVVNVNINHQEKILFGLLPKITIEDKGSYAQSPTKEYDLLAFRYLSWALFPLLFGYAIYSLFYLEHKGVYSFILSMLYSFLLTFGFILMTPQLFINYKLKSVAHLPWRMLTYKFLNTFIDDIFAFVIKMPTMYRLGCFRDDIIFLIFLYQRWVYGVDPKRVNEFGVTGEELMNENKEKADENTDQQQVKAIENKKDK